MPIRSRIAAPLFAVAILCLTHCRSPASDVPVDRVDLAITNVTVIDTENGFRPNRTILIDADQIRAVSVSSTIRPVARRIIDGRGKFLIPGLWDMHVHIMYDPQITAAMPELFLAYGITSVRDTGALLDEIVPEVARWRAPNAVAPRLFYAGPLLDGEKIVYDGNTRPAIGIANPTTAAARENVAKLKRAGVDFVKIYELVSPSVFEALVNAARAARLPIAAHVPLTLPASDAGPRVDSMEHLRNIELDCARDAGERLDQRRAQITQAGPVAGYELRRSIHQEHRSRAHAEMDVDSCDRVIASLVETIQVPTLRLNTQALSPAYNRKGWLDHVARLPAAARAEWIESAKNNADQSTKRDGTLGRWSLDLVNRMHEAGVPIGAGTDTPIGDGLPGYSLHTELERLVDAGLSPLDALRSATIRPAEFFGLEKQMGQIAVGQAADLVLLDADPLSDIRNTRRIHAVVSQGRVVRQASN